MEDTNTHQVVIDEALMSDYVKVMRDRSVSSKRTGDSDHKTVLTFTLRSDEEHVRAVTRYAVNMASSFESSAHPYVLSNIVTGLHAKVDLHNSLLGSISAGEEKCLARLNQVTHAASTAQCFMLTEQCT